jgi:hypothetical protein
MKKSGTITTLLFLALALGALFEAMKLPFGRVSTPADGFFPAVLAALLAVTSLLAFVDARRAGEAGGVRQERLTWEKILLTVGSLLAFAFLFATLGYLVTTFLFVTFLLRTVERKSWGLALAIGLSASFVSYVVFGLLLGTPLPSGFLQI